ncbi:hypothetical protein B0T18DRAFT_410289 [Schizothecium vesticola]|uniref:Secreted protein n=1 Tax=Schizothecium vesticola TaxID=314040 RepID=A0AA40EUR2_9PEZI|nr:hypothetical protein B0T18DRAFT_410289 [Schizothecium vesticola]
MDGFKQDNVHTAAAVILVLLVGSRPNCWAAMQEQGVGGRLTAWNKLGWDGAMMMMMMSFRSSSARQGNARRGRATMQSLSLSL